MTTILNKKQQEQMTTLNKRLLGETVMGSIQKIKRTLGVIFLGLGVLGFAGMAQAVPVSGKVYLDYDNSASVINSPPTLSGINVELLTSSGDSLSPAVTGVTTDSGDFTLEAPSIGSYQVKAVTATVGEEGIATVGVSGSTPVTGSAVFLKGLGGDISVKIADATTGVKNIRMVISSADMSSMERSTDASGSVHIKNALSGTSYRVVVEPSDIVADETNAKNYALWDATLNGSNSYTNQLDFTMSGTAQNGQFNVRERNVWGADAIVAVDQKGDGIYAPGISTPASGMTVELYYKGTTTKVLGQSAITTGINGKYNFKHLALGDYTVKVTNIGTYLPVTATSADFTVSTTGDTQPTAFNFLVKADRNDTTLASINGYVFALGGSQDIAPGPDSGKTGNTKPTKDISSGFKTKVKLYQHQFDKKNSTWKWVQLSELTTNEELWGQYSFTGLTPGKDYKVVVDESGINTSAYYFIGDTDGKSSSTSPASLSSHKGKVTLSNGSQDSIAGKEIILVNVTGKKEQQNFWYSTINKTSEGTRMYVHSAIKSLNNQSTWGGTLDGLGQPSDSMGVHFTGTWYEEDGVTLATYSNGTPLDKASFASKPDGYWTIGRSKSKSDHAGIYQMKLDSYDSKYVVRDTDLPAPFSQYVQVRAFSQDTANSYNTLYFKGIKPNSISGHLYINNSHPGATGSYNPEAGDIPVYAWRIQLARKQVSTGNLQVVSNFSSDADGYFNFTNLPDGEYTLVVQKSYGTGTNVDSDDVEFEDNISGAGTKPQHSMFNITLSGGQNVTDQDIWFKLKSNLVIKGLTYLDIKGRDKESQGDSELQLGVTPQNNLSDIHLGGVTVLLCNDGEESDCTIGGANYITHQVTELGTVNPEKLDYVDPNGGAYKFTGSEHGITVGTNYMVRAIKDGLTVVNKGALSSSYKASFSSIDEAPIRNHFLFQGKGRFAGSPVNDFNGNRSYQGINSAENGTGRSLLYYYDNGTASWVLWTNVGHYNNQFDLRSLPQGKYKIVHKDDLTKYLDIADSDPNSPAGTVEFEVLADGSMADRQPKTGRNFYQAIRSSIAEGVSGQIYLDVSGSGDINKAIPVPGSQLSGVSVKGYFTPRLYPDYTVGEEAVLSKPDFVDSQVAANDGHFAHTAANSTAGALYITNYLLKIEGLDTSKFELVANGGPKQSYLEEYPSIKGKLEYMQVTPSTAGAKDQYWMLKLKEPTEISGRLFYDLNGNGSFDQGVDTPMSGVQVELWQNGTRYSYTSVGADGVYTFSGLFDDTYSVKVTNIGLDTTLYELETPPTGAYNGLTINHATNPKFANYNFIYKKIGDASISGNVMLDINNDGMVDVGFNKQGDLALAGVTVELYKGSVSGTPEQTTQTNKNGYYSFFKDVNLNTSYIVKIVPPAGYGVINNANGASKDTLATINIGALPSSHSNQFFLLAGASNSNPSAGNGSAEANSSGIAGQTLLDDVTNSPLAGVIISLVDGEDKEIARQLSSATGDYHFYNLPADTYKVAIVTSPAGYALTKNAAGTTPLDVLSKLILTTKGLNAKNFWYKTASVKGIQGKVLIDFGDDNTTMEKDSNDFPLKGATVSLYDGIGANDGTKLGETTTDENGVYKFENLIYGTGVDYSIKLDMNSISDYAFKRSKTGTAEATGVIINVPSLVKEGSADNDYLVVGKLKVEGDVWIDADGDLAKGTTELVNGVKVTLSYKAPGATEYSELRSTTTATAGETPKNGQYSFANLPKGTDYKVEVDSDSAKLSGTSLIPAEGESSIKDNSATFILDKLSDNKVDLSSAYNYNGQVSGQVIIDIDSNNKMTEKLDTLFAGVKLELTATIDGKTVTKEVTTDAEGKFSLTNLPIANWSLKAAETQTLADWSSYKLGFVIDASGTPVPDTTSLSLPITLTATDHTFKNIVVGYQGTAKISGYVVIDIDPSDDKKTAQDKDTPVEGVKVTLSSDTAGFTSRETTTDSKGYYEFSTLAVHTYTVSVDDKNAKLLGHLSSFDPLGEETSQSKVALAVEKANSELKTQDFGYKSNGSLIGYIYRDVSGTGTRHAIQDTKLAGVKVKATQGELVRYSNETTDNGEYKIDNLATGKWTITLELPSEDYRYSYVTDTAGVTETVVTDGAEIDISPIAPRAAVKGATLSFGIKGSASIKGQVVIDVDDTVPETANVDTADIAIDTQFADYKATLYVGDTKVASSAVTAGAYSFTNLSEGIAYRVEVSQPSTDYMNSFNVASEDTGVTAGAAVNSAEKLSQTYTLTKANTAATNSNFGWKGVGSIAGDVYWDKDDNGSYVAATDSDVGEKVTVTLTHKTLPNITRTVESGSTAYEVTGLIPGSWTVSLTGVPDTFKGTVDPDDVFSATGIASSQHKAVITVGATALTHQSFGYIQGGAMTGVIKEDSLSTGSYDPTAPGLAGAEVTLLDSSGNALMGGTQAAIVSTTDSEGQFSFRNLDPSKDYKVQVAFGSATDSLLSNMEPSYDSLVGAINLATPPTNVDVMNELHTVDALVSSATNNELQADELYFGYRQSGGDLTIHKVALKEQVIVGDLVPYRITIENNLATPAMNMMIKDRLPAGFKFVSGSARLDGEKIADPVGGANVEFRNMTFGGSSGAGTTPSKRTLTYLLVVGAGVTQGEYVNTAVAANRRGENASNISQATVTVTADPLFDNSLIFGKVYVDRNGNGIQDEGEEGLGGVKLVTARGEIITTDQYGRYHLAGVEGGRWERGTNFVLKLDVRSLPAGYKVVGRNPIVTRLSPGLPSKVDFKVSEVK